QVRQAQAPQTDPRGADGGDLVVPREVGQAVEQGEQQRYGQDDARKIRRGDQVTVILDDVARPELFFLKFAQPVEQVSKYKENQKAAEAIAERDEQFAQQVAVEQAHSGYLCRDRFVP